MDIISYEEEKGIYTIYTRYPEAKQRNVLFETNLKSLILYAGLINKRAEVYTKDTGIFGNMGLVNYTFDLSMLINVLSIVLFSTSELGVPGIYYKPLVDMQVIGDDSPSMFDMIDSRENRRAILEYHGELEVALMETLIKCVEIEEENEGENNLEKIIAKVKKDFNPTVVNTLKSLYIEMSDILGSN